MRYTAEFCEREYNARASIPEHPQIFAVGSRRGAAAARLRDRSELRRDDRERLDLFPASRDGAPLLVYIHAAMALARQVGLPRGSRRHSSTTACRWRC